MGIRSLNGLDSNTTNVYINTNLSATEPVVVSQTSFNNPITVSLNGISGFGTPGQIMKVHSNGQKLVWGDDEGSNWTVTGTKIYPTTATHLLVNTTTNIHNRTLKINGEGEIIGQLILGSTITDGTYTFTLPSSTGTLALTSDLTGYITASSTNTLTNKTLDGTTCKVSTAQFIMEAGAGLKNTISQGYIDFFEAPSNGTNKITLQGQASLAGDIVLNLPSSTGTLALTSDIDTTTAQNFGTAVAGGNTIKLGNSAGTSQTTNLELYTSATLKIFNTSNVEVARFTPVSNTCNLTLNGGLITTATLSTNTVWNGTAIAYNFGGTGLTSLTANKILQVNSTATGYNLVDMPSAVQYWSESAGVLSPSTSSNTVRCESGLRLGTAGEFMDFDYTTGTNIFDIIHHDGGVNTEVLEYNASTDVMTIKQNTIFENLIQVNSIKGENSTTNTIKDDGARGWEFQAVLDSRMIAFENGSYYPFLGLSDSSNISFLIHINNIGDAYYINNDSNNQAGLRHEFLGNCLTCADDRASFKYDGSALTYFYNPSGSNGAASYGGSYFAYHNNGSAIYFNLSSGGTSAGDYYSFATNNSQKARIDMTGSGKITGSWTGSWSGTSDRRLKKNIVPIENAVETLMKINVYQFDKYDIDNFDCIHSDCGGKDCLKPFKQRLSENTRFVYGFIAQELCENTPEIGKMCVETNGWGEEEPAYIIDDRPILACAIKTIQTQQQEINTLKQEVNTYKGIIDKLIKAPSFKAFKESLA